MGELTVAGICSRSFDALQFVRELTKPSVGVEGLLCARQKVQALVDETNALLKKNVYKNYALFIETAKEISYLKSEMYQLSHLLSEEQSLLNSLLDTSISGDKTHGLTANEKKEVAAKFRGHEDIESLKMSKSQSVQQFARSTANIKELASVLEKVEGISSILETKNRILLHSGEMVELDLVDYKPLPNQGNIFGIILNDCLVLANSYPTNARSSGKKYKFQSFCELDNIAIINVKDPNFKTAFKILMMPQTRAFKVDTVESKKKWLDAFDQAKKQRRASLSLQRRDSLMFMPNLSMDTSGTGNQTSSKNTMSPIDRPYSALHNPFDEAEMLEDASESDATVPFWLIELPEDLDVCIAQRNFEEAVALVNKVNDHFVMYPKCDNSLQTDLKLRINHKIDELIEAIANELQVSPDRSLQSGPRAARRAVQLLIKLGKSSLAAKLFLSQRSTLLKFCLRQQKMEGATLQYIRRMGSVFFTNVNETCKEFQKSFDMTQTNEQSSVISLGLSSVENSVSSDKISGGGISLSPALACLVSWVHKQLLHFLSLFSRHVFTTQVSSTIASECVAIVRNQCIKLRYSVGIDLLMFLEMQLKTGIEKIISDCKEKLLEAIKLRSGEDKWQPQNHGNKAGITKFIEDMKDSGLSCVQNYVYDECRVSLTSNTTSFAKSFLNILHDLIKLWTPNTHHLIVDALVTTFTSQMRHLEKSMKKDQFKSERKFIRRNAIFLLDTLLPLAEQYFCEKLEKTCEELSKLHNDYSHLKAVSKDEKTKTMVNISEGKTYTTTTYL
ncbi:Exocyst complex component 8-like protein [Dinothrombium tinctorium]|uniref:Exocyst complex component 8-like protein n=1 Tax=Dinothrombium tinctorium TaxID=1965070 RepID=A0A3S3P311_9ACAR|nr:Exocyst complex component 8-like protein [Dinothrombium tinctorium]RWS13776.1 Exocyst complex component 8-like protein [Dinothrombium tinctorium]